MRVLTATAAVLVALYTGNSIANHNTQEALEARVSAVGTINITDGTSAQATRHREATERSSRDRTDT